MKIVCHPLLHEDNNIFSNLNVEPGEVELYKRELGRRKNSGLDTTIYSTAGNPSK